MTRTRLLATLLLATIVLAVALLAVACGSDSDTEDDAAPPADGPIRIGWVGPLSAGAVSEGEEMLAASRIAVDEVNEAGGVLGRSIELVVRNTKADPATGAAAMADLIDNERVVAVIGEAHSSVAVAEIEVAHDRGVPFVVAESWADEISAAQYREVFRIAPANSLIYEQVAAWVRDAGFAGVAVAVENTAYGENAQTLLAARFADAGLAATFIDVDPAALDVEQDVATLAATNPDLVMVLIASETGFPLINAICDAGLAPTDSAALYVGAGLGVAAGFWDALGDCGRNVIAESMVLPVADWNDRARGLDAALRADGLAAAIGGFAGYDSLWLVADAIERAGATDADAIIDALATTSLEGARGIYAFSTETDPPWHFQQFLAAPVTIIQYTDVDQSVADAAVLTSNAAAAVQPYATP